MPGAQRKLTSLLGGRIARRSKKTSLIRQNFWVFKENFLARRQNCPVLKENFLAGRQNCLAFKENFLSRR